jgi:hypothetical protein
MSAQRFYKAERPFWDTKRQEPGPIMFIMCIKFGGPLAPMTRMGGHFIRMLLAIDKLLDTKFNIDTLRHRPEGAAEDADEIIDYYMASWDQNHPEGKPQFRLQHYNAWRNFFSVFNGRPGRDGLTSYQSGFIHLLTPKVGLRAVGVGGWGEVGRERRWCGVWPGPCRSRCKKSIGLLGWGGVWGRSFSIARKPEADKKDCFWGGGTPPT